jgi:hypothetical protein
VDEIVRPFLANFFFNNNVLLKLVASVALEDFVLVLLVLTPLGKSVSELDSLSDVPFELPILGVNL